MHAPPPASNRHRLARFAAALSPAAPLSAAAHSDDSVPTLAGAWSLSPWVIVPLALFTLLYAAGVARLWKRAGVGHGASWPELLAFAGGTASLFFATVWPLDALGGWSLAAHMAQHMLLLAFVPPLLLAARPFAVIAHGLPRTWARRLHRLLSPIHLKLTAWLGASAIAHGLVMWIWHMPSATEAALASTPVHWSMHGSFLLAGLWFWAACWRRVRDPDFGAGAGAIALVSVMMLMGFLGALLTFSPRALYPVYVLRAPQLGLDPLADQQLAGIIMWIPACIPYLVGGLWLLWLAFRRIDRRSRT